MFFSERIVSINKQDRVLEIGPGGTPYERADEFLDIDHSSFKDKKEEILQRGSAPELVTDKKITFYDGSIFPFDGKSFAYSIASHVLEHVDDVDLFISELQRISKNGYLEYPTIFYEYLYNIPVHKNIIHYDAKSNEIIYIKKSSISLGDYEKLQKFFLDTLSMGYIELVDNFKDVMFEGFEWSNNKPLKTRESKDINDIIPVLVKIPKKDQVQTKIEYIEKEVIVELNNVKVISSKSIIKELIKRPLRKTIKIYKKTIKKPSINNLVKIDDRNLSIIVPPDMKWTFSEGDYYEKNVIYWAEKVINKQKNPYFYDVGANIGYYSLVIGSKKIPTLSFEPVGNTFRCLKKNIKINNLSNVKAVKIALSDIPGESQINVYSSSGNNSIVKRVIPVGHELKYLRKEKIKLETIDNISQQYNAIPTFIKIDVEGFEKNVINGAQKTINKYKPVILFEASANTSIDAGYNVDDLAIILKKQHYILYGLPNNANDMRLTLIKSTHIPKNIDNVLAIHESKVSIYAEILN